jgi:hypothetical protein
VTIRKDLPALGYLQECFSYDPATGVFLWRARPKEHFCSKKEWRRVNTRHAGTRAFARLDDRGYLTGGLDGESYKAHRVAWKLMTGEEPPEYIDHKDRNPQNNRWSNLRECTNGQNFLNRDKSWGKHGRGIKKDRHKWNARIHYDGKYIHLGTFDDKDAAVSVRKAAEKHYYKEFAS